MDPLLAFEDQVVLVTGATGGIGSALAAAFAARGAYVALVGTDQVRATAAAARLGTETFALAGDVSSVIQAEELVQAVLARWGRLNVLVNAAGVITRVPSAELNEADWDRVLDVNLKGTWAMSRAAARLSMFAAGSGVILNVSSVRALVGTTAGYGAYAASKAGVNGLTRQLAIEWASHGLRVNAVALTTVETPLTAGLLADADRRAAIVARTPLGRIATPDDVVGPALFLCSRAAAYVTGQVLYVDGGFTAWQ